jgi:hypothetical protein
VSACILAAACMYKSAVVEIFECPRRSLPAASYVAC